MTTPINQPTKEVTPKMSPIYPQPKNQIIEYKLKHIWIELPKEIFSNHQPELVVRFPMLKEALMNVFSWFKIRTR